MELARMMQSVFIICCRFFSAVTKEKQFLVSMTLRFAGELSKKIRFEVVGRLGRLRCWSERWAARKRKEVQRTRRSSFGFRSKTVFPPLLPDFLSFFHVFVVSVEFDEDKRIGMAEKTLVQGAGKARISQKREKKEDGPEELELEGEEKEAEKEEKEEEERRRRIRTDSPPESLLDQFLVKKLSKVSGN